MPEIALAFDSLLAFALLFGIRHGFDADHLASIDGLARLHSCHGRPLLAHLSGLLFSGGHGVVIFAAAALLQLAGVGQPPSWLAPAGALISIGFLALIGITNLRNALHPGAIRIRPSLSPVTEWIARLPLPGGWLGSLLVGALFALSLDAMTVAAWFSLAGSRHGGVAAALLLALAFVAGMVLTDTFNGLIVARLMRRSEAFVQRAGRLFSMSVACSALLVAGFGVAKLVSGRVDEWADGKELLVGLLLSVCMLTAYWVARRSRNRCPALQQPVR